jgi:teichoic acid transport system ATP-binding protein
VKPNGGNTEQTAQLAVRCVDTRVSYTVRSQRRWIRELLRGQKSQTRTIEAVKGVTFDIRVGESVGLVGPNGSGKTSLLQAMTGLLPTSGGRVLVRTVPTFLGVQAALNPNLTGQRNIHMGLLAQGLNNREATDLCGDVADFTGLGEFLDMRMEIYSSGMKARLHFAIATAIAPEILLIDEALAVGDKDFREKSAKRLDEHRVASGTVVLVSHSLPEIQRSCSRVIWMADGRIVADGPAEEVLSAYQAS